MLPVTRFFFKPILKDALLKIIDVCMFLLLQAALSFLVPSAEKSFEIAPTQQNVTLQIYCILCFFSVIYFYIVPLHRKVLRISP